MGFIPADYTLSLFGKLRRSVKPQSRLFSGLFPSALPVLIPPFEHDLVYPYKYTVQ